MNNRDHEEDRRRLSSESKRKWTKALASPGVLKAILTIGPVVTKVLRLLIDLVKLFKETFRVVKPLKPKASRDKSSETFLVGIGLKNPG